MARLVNVPMVVTIVAPDGSELAEVAHAFGMALVSTSEFVVAVEMTGEPTETDPMALLRDAVRHLESGEGVLVDDLIASV